MVLAFFLFPCIEHQDWWSQDPNSNRSVHWPLAERLRFQCAVSTFITVFQTGGKLRERSFQPLPIRLTVCVRHILNNPQMVVLCLNIDGQCGCNCGPIAPPVRPLVFPNQAVSWHGFRQCPASNRKTGSVMVLVVRQMHHRVPCLFNGKTRVSSD